ncbi:MAG: 23S rRNA (adenine(2503)-C(2))-methyltransferase RlmN [Deltaproteobacteria bacterium]|jgi:23S rRNA (adenine2503-C2)-methyltransferase|nr:23S rRNA (adenine(2503)-C(2))-methyltransferase RlmN [Deltaproteobacteria bacterium]
MKEFLTDIPLDSYKALVESVGMKPYAAGQLIQWLYQKRAGSFDEMTNLSKEVRGLLSEKYDIDALQIVDIQEASDGTKKYLCKAPDGECVECVSIPADDGRCTICISTQVGCKMGCSFCRTGEMGYHRNLSQGEILSQLRLVMLGTEKQITNIVLMGMGEPLDNYDAVSAAISIICDDKGFNMSKKRVTLSSAGLIPELDRFSEEYDVKIAISLNATTDEMRDSLMPINKKYPISEIVKFCRSYSHRSRNRITFEYVLIGGMNDSEQDAARLVQLLKGIRAKVNIIPFNPFDKSDLRAPDENTVTWWSEYLYNSGIQANIRQSRGQEILAACGQLATKEG